MRLKDRLREFMVEHSLTHEEMATILNTPYSTFAKWMREKDNRPPGCLVVLMDILDGSSEARDIAGVKCPTEHL